MSLRRINAGCSARRRVSTAAMGSKQTSDGPEAGNRSYQLQRSDKDARPRDGPAVPWYRGRCREHRRRGSGAEEVTPCPSIVFPHFVHPVPPGTRAALSGRSGLSFPGTCGPFASDWSYRATSATLPCSTWPSTASSGLRPRLPSGARRLRDRAREGACRNDPEQDRQACPLRDHRVHAPVLGTLNCRSRDGRCRVPLAQPTA